MFKVPLRGEYVPYESPGKTAHRKYIRRLRAAVIAVLGGRCVRCAFTDVRALQIDHVEGGGTQERRSLSGAALCRKILRDPASGKYQLLCANCNWIKRAERGEFVGSRRF